MPQAIRFQERLSHSYIDAYKHLDKFAEKYYTAKMMPGPLQENYDDSDSCWRKVYVEFRDRSVNLRLARKLLPDAFRSGCSCEHDCCGHFQTSAYASDVKRIRRGVFMITTHSYRNV